MIVDEDVAVGGGEMSARMRAFNSSCTPLGPLEDLLAKSWRAPGRASVSRSRSSTATGCGCSTW